MDNECSVLQSECVVAGTRNATLLDRLIGEKYSLQQFELTNKLSMFSNEDRAKCGDPKYT